MDKTPVIVTSNVKKTVKEISGFNTSMGAVEVLNSKVHDILAKAAENAKADGRKTVMDRDVQFVIEGAK